MKTDPGLLSVKRVIIHEVPQHSSKTEGQKPTLSDIESPLTTEIKGMLRVRIIEAVGSETHGFDIDWDPASTSPVPGLVKTYLADPSKTDFVLMSQQMANHLYSSQPPISPAGLLIVVECTLDPLFAIVIIKIEKEEGARIIRQDASGGKKDFRHTSLQRFDSDSKNKSLQARALCRRQGQWRGSCLRQSAGLHKLQGIGGFLLTAILRLQDGGNSQHFNKEVL